MIHVIRLQFQTSKSQFLLKKGESINLLGIWFRTLCLIFHLWALNATRLPWRCGKLCTNQALATILRMNQASAASCARVAPWHASKHEGGEATCARAKGSSVVCTSSASTCVRLGRVFKNHYICLKEFKISTLIRNITFMTESTNSYVNNKVWK